MLKSKYKRQRLVHCVHILIGDYSHISAMARYRNSSKYWRMREGDQRKREEEKGEERGKGERERQSKREREAERGRRKSERVGRCEGRKEQLK